MSKFNIKLILFLVFMVMALCMLGYKEYVEFEKEFEALDFALFM